MPSLRLKENARARVLQGHPWVFGNEVEELLPAEHDARVVECRDRRGRPLGKGIYNSRSQIVWRRLDGVGDGLDEGFLRAGLRAAIDRRRRGSELPPCCRLVWSESDNLPGVVVDRFEGAVAVQIQTKAMEAVAAAIGDLLAELLGAEEIVFRNDANIRRLEGLPLECHTRSGRAWEPRWVRIEGLDYWLDLLGGQKTGFYLDQRLQHAALGRRIGDLAAARPGPRVLDAFCNQGGFALHAARSGAGFVLGLDSAEEAVAAARRNAARNGVQADFETANVFDWLNDPARRDEAPWDVVVLDPPPFAKSKGGLAGALRGYKEINLRALQLLAHGGILATYTCSHRMGDAELRGVLAEAAGDARRRVRVLEWVHQPADHPVLATMPESEYFRGYVVTAE